MSNIFLGLHCPTCGKSISDADSLCPHCGTNLEAPLADSELETLARPLLERAQKTAENGGKLKEALLDCDQAIAYLPESAEAHNLRGLILDAMGKSHLAILAYQEALRLDPNFADAQSNLAELETEHREKPAQENTWIKDPRTVFYGCIGIFGIAALAGIVILSFLFARPFLTPKQTIILEPDLTKISSVTRADLEKTAKILAQRWQAIGYNSQWVSFVVSDEGKIIGRIPADIDAETIKRTNAYGLLEFVDFGKEYFPDGTIVNTDFASDYFPQVSGKQWHTVMTNSDIQTVAANLDRNKNYEIAFSLTEKGTKIFTEHTAQNIGTYLGIVLDKVILSCPKIMTQITDGSGVITGNFTQAKAESLVALLQTEPLPIPLK